MKRSRRIMTYLILLLGMLALPSTAAASDSSPTIAVSSAAAEIGETVDITVSLRDNPGIVAMRLRVSYDTSALALSGVTDSGLLGGAQHGTDPEILANNPYTLFWMNGTSEADNTANGVLVTLHFIVKETAAEGTYPVSISYSHSKSDILNYKTDKVSFAIENGSVSVAPIGLVVGLQKAEILYRFNNTQRTNGYLIAAQQKDGKMLAVRMSGLIDMKSAQGRLSFPAVAGASYRLMFVNSSFVPTCEALSRTSQ